MIKTIHEIRLKITGTLPLLMCRGELANPFDPYTKELAKQTSIRKKEEENHKEISRLKFAGSLYYDEKIGPFLPTDNFFKALQMAAAKTKKAQEVKSSVIICGIVNGNQDSGAARLNYKGPRTIEELWNNGDSPFIHRCIGKPPKQGKIVVTRAIFPVGWWAEFVGKFDTAFVTRDEMLDFARLAGNLIAIGAWRPKYGQFSVEEVQ